VRARRGWGAPGRRYALAVPTFDAPIQAGSGGGAWVEVPPEVVAALGGGGRIPVEASFDGVAYRGSVVSMGGRKVLGVLAAIRAELGKGVGDTVAVSVDRDVQERTVAVAPDLAEALDGEGLRAAFDALSYSHRREHVQWIDEAKKPETRQRRIARTLERLQG
jgi:hypothetical protein